MTTSICSICLEPLARQDCTMVVTVPCGHAYHEQCLKHWATERLNEDEPKIYCPVCNTQVDNVCKLFLSTKTGTDDSLCGKELDAWRKEYDAEAKGERLKLHAKVLESNKQTIDEIFKKQKIMEKYEEDRLALDEAKLENEKLRKELYEALLKQEEEYRKMQANRNIINEVLARNESALKELKQTREENLDLKRELLRNIMGKQADMKKLSDSKLALSAALENQETALGELKKTREENLALKKELVEHLHHHKQKMEQLQTHKESLHDIVVQHGQNIAQLEEIKNENLKLKEELLQSIVLHKQDATKLASCEGWIEVLKEEVQSFEKERAAANLILQENSRLGNKLKHGHKRWLDSRRELNATIHESALQKMNLLIGLGEIALFGLVMIGLRK